MRNQIDRILFKLRWLGMSERSRYALLWARTRDNLDVEYYQSSRWAQKSE